MYSIKLGKYAGKDVTTDTAELFNGHVGIVGGSGGGKTVKAQDIMIQIAENGGTVIAYDLLGTLADDQIFECYNERYRTVLHSIDVQKDGMTVNLFTPIRYNDGSLENPQSTVGAIVDMFARSTELGARQKATLRSAVNSVMQNNTYETDGLRAIDDALAESETDIAISVREKLAPLLLHNIFRPGNDFIHEGKINVIRLSRYDVNTQIAISEVINAYLWRMANGDAFKENQIYLFIDECQNMPSGKNSMLAQMLSEGRRFGMNLILATQQLQGGSYSAVQRQFTQCGLLLYFKPLSNQINSTAEMINPSDKREWVKTLQVLRVGEFVASGSFLVNGHRCYRPLKIDGKVKTRKYFEKEDD